MNNFKPEPKVCLHPSTSMSTSTKMLNSLRQEAASGHFVKITTEL